MILEEKDRKFTSDDLIYCDHPFSWVGHPSCENQGELERKFIDNRSSIEIIGGIKDDTLSYEYDEFAIVRYGGELYVLQTSGCSCPSPSETWKVIGGPATKEFIVSEIIRSGNYNGYTVPKHLEEELIAVVESA